ncbi:flagellin, partial [Thiomicrorhabdus heinhorstiae]
IAAIDQDLSNINLQRAKWGALQNRLESTVSNLSNVNENISAARSRIEDADFAKESANLARTQVLQQAGMSMLSQANQQSQNVLSLVQ